MKKRKRIPSSDPAAASGTAKIRLARGDDGAWELRHPRCAKARQEDIEEVERMIAGGEVEIAQDELRWLLEDCHDFLTAHKLLGDLALAAGELKLARGHFGYAYQIGLKAIKAADAAPTLSYAKPANREFFEAGRGLAMCLMKLGKRGLARDVIGQLLQLDANDPLKLRPLIDGKHR